MSADTTVEDVKILIAKAVRMSDHNRIGLFDPSTKKTLKNRQARIADEQAVASTGEVLVKDLGRPSRPCTLAICDCSCSCGCGVDGS